MEQNRTRAGDRKQGIFKVWPKESSVCIEFCDRHIGGLAGYRFPPQSGLTRVRDLLGRCLYFRRQKKLFLAFMILWSIDGLAERS